MSIYDYDTDVVGEQLTPPILRQPIFLTWLKVLLKPIQWLWSLVFEDFADGSNYLLYDNSTAYVATNRVIFTDNKVYECILASTGNDCLNTTYWVKINENFIGIRERAKYNSQIILLEYSLNKWFQNLSATDQIYVNTNQINSNSFVMGETGAYSSAMASNSPFSTTFMGMSPSFSTQYNLTINVPNSLFLTLGSNAFNQEQSIRNYADKYIVSGVTYNVITY